MAGPATSVSRMGVHLQGLDQVIALSQANINESLEYHFSAKPDLCVFDASLKSGSKEALKGVLKPPTIELVDVENADQALYCLEFESGDYSYWDFEGDEPKKAKKPAKGWRLAFYVDFALKKMAQVPKEIADKIQLPGSYSVDQLLVNFGTADTMNFNWDRSKISGFETKDGENAAKDTITLFVTKCLYSLKAKDNTGSHNVLGNAVKIDPEPGQSLQDVLNRMPHSTPSFPPTAVRLQTINHRPGGDPNRSTTDNDHNAFLFTEMSEGRALPSNDLQWTGDWFYESIGGTLAMSRKIFWDRFMARKLQVANMRAVEGAHKMARLMSMNIYPNDWWLLSESKNIGDGAWSGTNGLVSQYSYNAPNRHTYYEPDVDGPNPQYSFDVATAIQSTLTPFPGEGKVELRTVIEMNSTQVIEMSFVPTGGAKIECAVKAVSLVTIKFRSVAETGDLSVDVESHAPEVDAGAKIGSTSIFAKIPVIGPALESLAKDMSDASKFEKQISDEVKRLAASAVDVHSDIQDALNGQGRFVFPGGGTFDMKDPIFNQAGDLMIGLTYRKGDAATGS